MPTFLQVNYPTAVVGGAGSSVTLNTLLANAFGTNAQYITGAWLAYYGAPAMAAWDFQYWNMASQVVSQWRVNGTAITAATTSAFNQTYVASSSFGTVDVRVGNNCMPNMYMTVRIDNGAADPVYMELALSTVNSAQPGGGAGVAPTASSVVDAAIAYSTLYPNTPNDNDCHWISTVIGAAVGAPLTNTSGSIVPAENIENGFWRIAHRGSDNPVANWETLVLPGDIVRFDWADPAQPQHTTLILGTLQSNGTIEVYDNSNWVGGTSYIGRHMANYDVASNASSVTIYRLSSDGLYLMKTTDTAETVLGTVFNDHIIANGGNDILRGGQGNDQLNGGNGVDRADYLNARSDYFVRTVNVSGTIETIVTAASGTEGSDRLVNVETMRFGAADFRIAGADLNRTSNAMGSRFDDVVFHNDGTGMSHVKAMTAGAVTAAGAVNGSNGSHWDAVDTGDMNADGIADIAYRNASNGTLAFGLMSSNGVTGYTFLSNALNTDWRLVGVADVDGDIHTDVVVQNNLTGAVSFADMTGLAFGGWRAVSSQGTGWQARALGDVNRDGVADVVYQHTNGTISVGLMSTSGAVQSYAQIAGVAGWTVKESADVNGDGFADILIQRVSNGDISYANMANGTFAGYGTVINGFGTAWQLEGMSDTNNDGDMDAIIRNVMGSGDTYVVNMQNGAFQSFTLVAQGIGSQWYVV